MDEKLISVVIPMYNRMNKIGRALDSVFAQTAVNKIGEIIVVDDGSTDDSVAVVQNYKASHNSIDIVIITQSNHGPSYARNKGMSIAKYKYIAFLDSDDEWLPNKIFEQLKVFEAHTDADFVGGNENNNYMRILTKRIKNLYKAKLSDLCIKSFPVTPSVIMKKKIFDNIGGFDESMRHYEDCDYFQRICAAGYGYYYIPTQLVICDQGKNPFGESGLSANLKQAHIDSIISLKKLKESCSIGIVFYYFLRVFYFAKYMRRIILSQYQKIKFNKSMAISGKRFG
jgi:glycosyltransferase involved in cell wall biosynthesis